MAVGRLLALLRVQQQRGLKPPLVLTPLAQGGLFSRAHQCAQLTQFSAALRRPREVLGRSTASLTVAQFCQVWQVQQPPPLLAGPAKAQALASRQPLVCYLWVLLALRVQQRLVQS